MPGSSSPAQLIVPITTARACASTSSSGRVARTDKSDTASFVQKPGICTLDRAGSPNTPQNCGPGEKKARSMRRMEWSDRGSLKVDRRGPPGGRERRGTMRKVQLEAWAVACWQNGTMPGLPTKAT